MRVADRMAYDQVNRNISRNRTEMAQLQNQAATQKRVTKPSDDPVAASRVLSARTEQKGIEQYIKNLNYARSFLDYTEQSLGELSEILVRAKELALSQANDASSNAQTKKVVAAEIAQLHNQAIQIGNRKLGERYIFGGYKTTDTPFDASGAYRGDSGELKIHIDKDSFLAMNLPGSAVFLGKGLSKDGVSFRTQQQPRTVEELKQLQAQSAPTAGSNSPTEDDTQPVTQDNLDGRAPASLRTPAKLQGSGQVSEAYAAHYAENQDEDSHGINIFATLKNLETSLMANDKEGVQESLDALDEAIQQVVLARTQLGSRVMTIDSSLNSLHTSNVDTKGTISHLEDVDAFEVISNMNKTEATLQATLQTSGKMIQKSLMDFIS